MLHLCSWALLPPLSSFTLFPKGNEIELQEEKYIERAKKIKHAYACLNFYKKPIIVCRIYTDYVIILRRAQSDWPSAAVWHTYKHTHKHRRKTGQGRRGTALVSYYFAAHSHPNFLTLSSRLSRQNNHQDYCTPPQNQCSQVNNLNKIC